MVIQSVLRRQQATVDFSGYYDSLCALQSSAPLPAIKAHLSEGVIDVNVDRIRHTDWAPLLTALSVNRSIEFVGFRSYFTNENGKSVNIRKQPAITSKDLTYRLCCAIRDCLAATQALACLEIEGTRLRERDMAALGRGIAANSTLKSLSLEGAKIGDVGVEHLCRALRHAGNVSFVNLSGNSLTWRSAEEICKLIKYQATSRHNDAWRDSLRYRIPNFDSMHGLRRISINGNPLIDDQGARLLAEALKDDLWVKAIDLQGCGIGNAGAKSLLSVLKYNTTLVVLDLRKNSLIDREVLHAVTEQVIVNSDGKDSEFKWLKASDDQQQQQQQLQQKALNGHGQPNVSVRVRAKPTSARPVFKPAGGRFNYGRHGNSRQQQTAFKRRSRSAEPRDLDKEYAMAEAAMRNQSHKRGIPWRTADRASKYKGYPVGHTPGKPRLVEATSPFATPLPTDRSSAIGAGVQDKNRWRPSSDGEHDGGEEEEEETTVVSPLLKELEQSPPAPRAVKDLQVKLVNLRRRLQREAEARRLAEEEASSLRSENLQLRNQLQRQEQRGVSSIMQDEELLESIEASFKQFYKFLDSLRDKGNNRVITEEELDELQNGMLVGARISTGTGTAAGATADAGASNIRERQRRQNPTERPKQSRVQQQQAKQQQRRLKQRLDDQNFTVGDSLDYQATLEAEENDDEYYKRDNRMKNDANSTYNSLRQRLEQSGAAAGDGYWYQSGGSVSGQQVLHEVGSSGQQPLLMQEQTPQPESSTAQIPSRLSRSDGENVIKFEDISADEEEEEEQSRPVADGAAHRPPSGFSDDNEPQRDGFADYSYADSFEPSQ